MNRVRRRLVEIGIPAVLLCIAPVALAVARGVESRASAASQPRHATSVSVEHEVAISPPSALRPPLLGIVVPEQTLDLAPPVAGRVLSVRARIGETVHEGDVVATLDARLTRSDLAAARAAARSQALEHRMAMASEKAAIDHENRVLALAREGLASTEDVTQGQKERQLASLRVIATSAGIAQKDAQAQRLSDEKDLMEIRAPFDAAVVARFCDPGASVSPIKPLLRLISASRLLVRFAVPEDRAGEIHEGDAVDVVSDAGDVTFRGKVERLAPEIDTSSRAILGEASIDAAAPGVVSGLVVRVTRRP
jgi:RND family efflux transporter MFP subunit